MGRAGAASAPCLTPGPLVLTGTGRLCQGSGTRAGEGRAPSSARTCLWPPYSAAHSLPWLDADWLPVYEMEKEAVNCIEDYIICKEKVIAAVSVLAVPASPDGPSGSAFRLQQGCWLGRAAAALQACHTAPHLATLSPPDRGSLRSHSLVSCVPARIWCRRCSS